MIEQNRVFPMRLYATWEVDRTSSSCVPRSCVVAFDRLTILRNVVEQQRDNNFLTSLIVAVKLQGYKRTLRSNDINVTVNNGIIDVDLDITFTLQYPHFVKRKSINLFVMIQRRKKYKTRPILGFKTLAVGVINLNQVLQNSLSFNRELNLFTNINKKIGEKSQNLPDAKLYLNHLSTQPLENEDLKGKNANVVYESADDDDDDDSTPNEEMMGGVASDNEQQQTSKKYRRRRTTIASTAPASKSADGGKLHRRQKNLKQRFINLLKRFKVAEEGLDNADDLDEDFRGDVGADVDGNNSKAPTQREIDALFEELENLSDSGPECDAGADALSVRSTPKPQLRPFFNSNVDAGVATADVCKIVGGVASEESKESAPASDDATTSDQELSDSLPPPPNKTPTQGGDHRRSDVDVKTLKIIRPVAEQLSAAFGVDDLTSTNVNPVVLIGVQDVTSQTFVNCLTANCKDSKIFILSALNDVKTVFNALLVRIQRFCNVNAVHPPCLKMVLVGGDKFLSICLRAYVECLAPKPNEYLHFVKFYLMSQGGSTINRYLCALDRTYSQLFSTNQILGKQEMTNQECQEWANRIGRFLGGAKSTVCLPVAEVMLQLKEKGFTDETSNCCSTQIFVPFVGDVRLGASVRMDSFGDESQTSAAASTSNAAVVSPAATSNRNQDFSPPGSPRFHADAAKSPSQNFNDVQDLQIEYWTQNVQSSTVQQPNAGAAAVLSRKDTQNLLLSQPPPATSSASVAAGSTLIVKQSVKTGFRSLTVSRVPPASNLSTAAGGDSGFLTLNFIREKKRDKVLQKLGMKKGEKDQQEKKHTVENVSRLICSSTKQHGAMKVYIDGVEWSQVKFFQISTQWQTHVKFLPLALFNID